MEGTKAPDFAAALDQIGELGKKVGLTRTDLPTPEGVGSAPENTALWTSSYACVLFWPCEASDSVSVEHAAAAGQAWFDEVLIKGERKSHGRPIDGYLVLALPQAPDEVAREDVQRIELSTQVCRKHLIWPSSINVESECSRWVRVDNVTVLGLPYAMAAPGTELHWPELDAAAQEIWAALDTAGVSEALQRYEGEV